jgi:hypothetical protein
MKRVVVAWAGEASAGEKAGRQEERFEDALKLFCVDQRKI